MNSWWILSIGDNQYYGGKRNNKVRIVNQRHQASRFYSIDKAEIMQLQLRVDYPMESIQLVACKDG